MSEENKVLVRRIYQEVFNDKYLDAFDKSYAAGFVDHTLPPGFPPGIDGAKVFIGMFLSAFPNLHM